ncbi:MAG TPA: Gfo/Idh/MocA family oxidoreductase [bacterium]|nr:Gfo/Idh/MocA family oxidoreductase [bacterium]
MTAPLRVGLLGCGRIARLAHLAVLSRLRGVTLVALAEADPRRRAEVRRPAGVAMVADYRELLDRPDVEAVIVALPPSLHADAAITAFERGKHVYMEKPLALNLAEAGRMLATWRRSGLVGMIGFNYRFNQLYETARERICAGRLGELVTACSVFSTSTRPMPEWEQTRARGGGALLSLGSHHIDLMRFLLDREIRDVSAGWRTQRTEHDTAVLQMRLDDGVLVQSFFSLSGVEEDRVEIYGQEGKLTVDRSWSLDVEISPTTLRYARARRLVRTLRALRGIPHAVDKIMSPGHEPSYRTALAHFAAAVRFGRRASPDFCDGYRSLAVVEAAERCASTGRWVSVGDPPDAGGMAAASGAAVEAAARRPYGVAHA